MEELVANFTLNNESLDASFDVSEGVNLDALFQINVTPDISDLATKEELQETADVINNRIDEIVDSFDEDIETINTNITGITNDIITLDGKVTSEVATLNTRIDTEVANINTELATKIDDIQANGVLETSRVNNIVTVRSKNFVFEQGVASAQWVIVHNLGKKPSVILIDSAGTTFKADIEYDNENQCTVHINGATTGKAYLN